MKTIGNIIWFVIVGFWTALLYFLLGLIWCCTIIGIPFGKQAFKLARLVLWPVGTSVTTHFDKHPIANLIWLIFGGLELAAGYLLAAFILCITIIGIPYAKQCLKLAVLSCIPFGAKIK